MIVPRRPLPLTYGGEPQPTEHGDAPESGVTHPSAVRWFPATSELIAALAHCPVDRHDLSSFGAGGDGADPLRPAKRRGRATGPTTGPDGTVLHL